MAPIMAESPDQARLLSANPEYRTLLAVSEAIVSHRDLRALVHDLAGLLHQVVRFDHLLLGLHDAATNTMRPHVLESMAPLPHPLPASMPVEGCPMGRVWLTQQPLIFAHDDEEAGA